MEAIASIFYAVLWIRKCNFQRWRARLLLFGHVLRDYSFTHSKDLTKSIKFSTARVLYAPVLYAMYTG